MTTDELHRLREFRAGLPAPGDETRRAIYARAVGAPTKRHWRRRTAVTIAVAMLAAVGAASALAYHFLGPSPGFTSGLSSLDTLPQATWPASLPTDALDHAAAAAGISSSEAAQRLRLVQSGLSLGQEDVGDIDLYAFAGNDGAGCLFITGPDSGGICLPSWMTANPALDGVAWAVGGGRSRQTPGPLAVYGLVADDVRTVEADVGGTTDTIPIVNNSFYAAYDAITSSETIQLIVKFDDGTTRSFHAPNPYAG